MCCVLYSKTNPLMTKQQLEFTKEGKLITYKLLEKTGWGWESPYRATEYATGRIESDRPSKNILPRVNHIHKGIHLYTGIEDPQTDAKGDRNFAVFRVEVDMKDVVCFGDFCGYQCVVVMGIDFKLSGRLRKSDGKPYRMAK